MIPAPTLLEIRERYFKVFSRTFEIPHRFQNVSQIIVTHADGEMIPAIGHLINHKRSFITTPGASQFSLFTQDISKTIQARLYPLSGKDKAGKQMIERLARN